MTDELAKRKVLGLIGLGLRGRLAVVGVQQVRVAAKRGRVKVALVARDASQNSLDKVSGLLDGLGVPVIESLTAAELGAVAGREAVAVIGVTDSGLAGGIINMIPPVRREGIESGVRTARPSSRRDSRR